MRRCCGLKFGRLFARERRCLHDPLGRRTLGQTDRDCQEGFVTPATACWMYVRAVAESMRKISYAGYRFPPEVILILRQPAWKPLSRIGSKETRGCAQNAGRYEHDHPPEIPAVGVRLQRSRPFSPAAIFVPRLLDHQIVRTSVGVRRRPAAGATLAHFAHRTSRSRHAAAFSAWSRSARMSSICSMPIDSRT
jgi:hypothetical protein